MERGVQDLRLVGIADDGVHLLLASADGDRFRLPLDASLRTTVRHERPRAEQADGEPVEVSPRQVQALIRAGASADEVAELSGWTRDKVARYEGPIIAEREHVAGLATAVRLRGGAAGGAPLLGARVAERLAERGVDATTASWDAWRAADSPWTLALTFAAGGRLREARWHFDIGARSVEAVDDEARWLSGDDAPQTPEPLVPLTGRGRVYDVESEGGIHSAERKDDDEPLEPILVESRARRTHEPDEDSELVASMRERSKARRRARPAARRGRGNATQESLPGTDQPTPTPALPDVATRPVMPEIAESSVTPEIAANPVGEIDAIVEQARPSDLPSTDDADGVPPLPQGGPVSDAALAPDPQDDGGAPAARPDVADPAASSPDHDPTTSPSDPSPTPDAAAPSDRAEATVQDRAADQRLASAGDPTPADVAVEAEPGAVEVRVESPSPAVQVERTVTAPVPVEAPHPHVPGQVRFPGMEHDRSAPASGPGGGPSDRPVPTEEPEIDESASLADHTSGTASRAAHLPDDRASEPAPASEETPTSESPQTEEPKSASQSNRAQRRAQQRRKSGRPSVPSWDDIMFGAKKDD